VTGLDFAAAQLRTAAQREAELPGPWSRPMIRYVSGPARESVTTSFHQLRLTVPSDRRVLRASIFDGVLHAARRWVEGDALALPFENNSFDAITLSYGLRNVADIPQCLRELHRVLRPGAYGAAPCHLSHTSVRVLDTTLLFI
jgi:SAM-dependent methyltransferase